MRFGKFKIWRRVLLLIFIVIISGLHACMTFRESDKGLQKDFDKLNIALKIYHEHYDGKEIRFIGAGEIEHSKPTIVFIHGAPGSSADYTVYFKDKALREKSNLIAVDRLGYGYSDFGKAEVSLDKQAAMILFILKKYNLKNTILVGHSYGGPIAAKLAAISTVGHVLLLAPAISPEDEKIFGISHIGDWTLTRWMVPKALRVATDEKMTHQAELEKMLPDWSKIRSRITYIHGDKDFIVPYANLSFIQDQIPEAQLNTITIPEGNHFIPWKNYGLVKKELLNILESLEE